MSAHDTALLAETPLFARLDDVERAELADLLVVKSYTAGETVFYHGDPGDGLYLVRSGRVQARLENDIGETLVLGEIKAGDIFGSILAGWVAVNALMISHRPFDPYPFILLNLVLSTLAALQAPVIMMSQNRQSIKDRIKADLDYQINLEAELEIAQLHRKMDRLSELLQGHFARGMPAPSINGTPARVHQDEEIIRDR